MGSREPRRPDTYIPMVSLAGRPAFHHVRMCQHVFALYSALATALDSDERWLEARKRKDKGTYVREKTLRSGERLN